MLHPDHPLRRITRSAAQARKICRLMERLGLTVSYEVRGNWHESGRPDDTAFLDRGVPMEFRGRRIYAVVDGEWIPVVPDESGEIHIIGRES